MTTNLAIVAGTGPGIGAALARRFAAEGMTVALIARGAATLEQIAKGIAAAGGTATVHPADLSDTDDVARVLSEIADRHGAASVMLWNAAIWAEVPALELSPQDFAAQLHLGVISALQAAQAVAPGMEAAGGGTILMTGGGLALAPEYGGTVPGLTAVKSALRGLVLAAAPEFAARGIRLGTVTVAGTVAPGTAFDPDRIAAAFWRMHRAAAPEVEHVVRGEG